jgi:hypothetical protein
LAVALYPPTLICTVPASVWAGAAFVPPVRLEPEVPAVKDGLLNVEEL